MEIILPIFLFLILRFKSWKCADCLPDAEVDVRNAVLMLSYLHYYKLSEVDQPAVYVEKSL